MRYGVKRIRHETGRVVQFISGIYISQRKIIKINKTKAKNRSKEKENHNGWFFWSSIKK